MMARSRATERETLLVFLLPSRLRRKLAPCTLAIRVPLQKKKRRGYTNVNSQFVVECVMRGTENGKNKNRRQHRNCRKL